LSLHGSHRRIHRPDSLAVFQSPGPYSPTGNSQLRAPVELLRWKSLRTHGIGSSVGPRTILEKVCKRKSSCC
jgi:hypothetical protein